MDLFLQTPLSSDLILYSEYNGTNVDDDEEPAEGHLAPQCLQSGICI